MFGLGRGSGGEIWISGDEAWVLGGVMGGSMFGRKSGVRPDGLFRGYGVWKDCDLEACDGIHV